MGGKGIIRAGPLVSGFRVGAGKVGYQESCNTPVFVGAKHAFWRILKRIVSVVRILKLGGTTHTK